MLTTIAENVWGMTAEQPIPLGARYPNRMSVIKLTDGSLLLWSPVPIDDALARELDAIGPVKHLVAPNRFHYLHQRGAKRRYPHAVLHAAPGLKKKVPTLPIDDELSDEAPAALRADIETKLIGGASVASEVVAFHKASRTLFACDVVFHVTHANGWRTKLMLWSTGASGGAFTQSRLFKLVIRDRAAYRASIDAICAWPFTRVVMSHGDVIEGTDAVARFRQAAL